MLKELGNDGHMKWDCPGCGRNNVAHVADSGVQYTTLDPNMVALPACTCGTQTFLKVAFTDEELATSFNFMEPVFNDSGVIVDRKPTPSLAAANRHKTLATQMQAAGKSHQTSAPGQA